VGNSANVNTRRKRETAIEKGEPYRKEHSRITCAVMTLEQVIPAATLHARTYNGKLRYEVFSHYCGGEPHCQCPGCKTTFIEFLQLDHVNGDGAAHRKANNLLLVEKNRKSPPGVAVHPDSNCRN